MCNGSAAPTQLTLGAASSRGNTPVFSLLRSSFFFFLCIFLFLSVFLDHPCLVWTFTHWAEFYILQYFGNKTVVFQR